MARDLYNRRRRLEEQVEDFHLEDMQHSEIFVSAAMQPTRAAIATHQQAKREYLCNALVNTALNRSPDEDQIQMFLRYIEELTTWHVRFLQLFQAPRDFLESKGVRFNVVGGFSSQPGVFNYSMGSPSRVVEMAFSELKRKESFYDQIANDLRARGMLNSPADFLHTTMSAQGMLDKRTTDTADHFLAFIRDPLEG